jgi:hypothetical protein
MTWIHRNGKSVPDKRKKNVKTQPKKAAANKRKKK